MIMEKVRNILLLVIISISFSCSYSEGNFTISNESDFDIDSLSILPDSKRKHISLKKGEKVNHVVMMNEVKTDGSYFISFKNSESKEIISTAFGYYTNGYQVEDNMNIKILNDTIMFDSKFDNSY